MRHKLERMRYYLQLTAVLITLALGISCTPNRIHSHDEWAKVFEEAGFEHGAFLLRDHNHDAVHYYNLDQDTSKMIPASTFKIVLSLVGLETGILLNDQFIIPFNGIPSGNPDWDKDMSLREAFKSSSEPYFKELARRIGKEKLQKYLDTLNYGTKTLGDSVSECWHDNSLRISADEQVGLMRRLYFNKLPFTERSQRIVRSMMLQQNDSNNKWYYKTGWGKGADTTILWVVGFVEYKEKSKELQGSMNKSDERNYVYFFAENIKVPNAKADIGTMAPKRIEIAKKILNQYWHQSHVE